MSNKVESSKRTYGPQVADLFRDISLVPEMELQGVESFKRRSITAKGPVIEVLMLNYARILDSLAYGNSFVGNDYFILRYMTNELLLYWRVLRNEDLTESQANSCRLEIETYFYFYLNCIYNLKSKFEALVGFENNKVPSVVLNDDATERLHGYFKAAYPKIGRHCEARRYVVHGTYELKLLTETGKIMLSCSHYDLLPANVYEVPSKKMEFDLSDTEIIAPVASIYSLTTEVLETLRNLDNVNVEKLAAKFVKQDKEKGIQTIAF